MADQPRDRSDGNEDGRWRDRPVENEADKDIKEGGMEQEQQQQQRQHPHHPYRPGSRTSMSQSAGQGLQGGLR